MKTKLFVMLGILIITFAATVAPVMGAAATATIDGNMAPQVSISTVGEITNWVLVAGVAPNTNTGAQLNISANTPFVIAAKDERPAAKPEGTAGKMAEVVSLGTYVAEGKYLATPLEIDSATTNSVTATNIVALTAADQTLYSSTGAQGYSYQLLPLTFKQMVGLTEPRVSNALNAYRIPVVFTITATA